jgi:uncharacterized protein involved in type VI secretion and phage assembly
MTRPIYELEAGSLARDDLQVRCFSGCERMNGLYELEIEVLVADPTRNVEALALGAPARFLFNLDTRPRVFHGLIREVEALGMLQREVDEFVHYRMQLVPRLWLLTQQRNSRVFQNVTVQEVVRTILDEAFIPSCWLLTRQYPVRELCIQYEETDYDYICRLLAEHGIFHFFEQPPAALSEAASLLMQGASAIMPGAGNVAGGLLGGLGAVTGGLLSGVAGLPSGEIVVFGDDPMTYPPLSTSPEQLVSALLQQVEQVASSIVGAGLVDRVRGELREHGRAIGLQEGALRYRPDASALQGPEHESVRAFSSRGRVRPLVATFRDVDPRRPHVPLAFARRADTGQLGDALQHVAQGIERLAAGAAEGRGPSIEGVAAIAEGALDLGRAAAEGAVDLGRALADANGGRRVPLEVYDHHTTHLFPQWPYEQTVPRRILESARRDSREGLGASANGYLTAGHHFRLEDHPIDWMNGAWVITEVDHRGASRPGGDGPVYENGFRCVPSTVPYVPARPPRRTVQTCVTATVVGGDEIHTADFTMVKVRFHWDRRGAGHDTSCWIRSMQPWSGAGWGTQFIPREGMEVVVGFDCGDVDKPIVLGCVYNGTHPPPFALPVSKTRSGIRTHSTPGAAGHNELSFEDAASREQIYLHAQRDFDQVVEHDRTARIGHNDHTDVGGHQTVLVHEGQEIRVRGGRTLHVESELRTETHGVSRDVVWGSRHDSVSEVDQLHVTGDRRVEIGGNNTVEVTGDRTERVTGNQAVLVGTHDAPRSRQVRVEGVAEVSASTLNAFTSDREVYLQCGRSYLRIAPERIEIVSDEIRLMGKGSQVTLIENETRLFAENIIQGRAETINMRSNAGAGASFTREAAIDGTRVLLNSPAQAEDRFDQEEREPTIIELVDDAGNPIPYQQYRIELEDGSERTGVLDQDGRAVIDLDSPGRIEFPGLADVETA